MLRVSAPALLTVAEAAKVIRGRDDRDACDFVRGLIVDGRLSAIKQRGRWYVQAKSIEEIATPKLAGRPPATPPRMVSVTKTRRRVA